MKVLHIINGLGFGGAESMLHKLLANTDRERFRSEVVSLTRIGGIGKKIVELDVPTRALGLSRKPHSYVGIARLARWIRQDRPDVVQTWLYYADLVGGLAARAATSAPIVWNLRHSRLDERHANRTLRFAIKACARLANRLPRRIICGSEAARRVHLQHGYPPEKLVVIPNGFDLDRFRPDPRMRDEMRREIGVPGDALVVGLIGRLDPNKDHLNFLNAAARLANERSDIHFLLCGRDLDSPKSPVATWIRDNHFDARCTVLGERRDIERVHSALDVTCSSSSSEGFPNVIGEAMASGVPCVVTDVGDSATIVASTGRVVPPRDAEALAEGVRELVDMGPEGRRALGVAARRRIEAEYGLRSIVKRYEALYEQLVDRRPSHHLRVIDSRASDRSLHTSNAVPLQGYSKRRRSSR